MVIITTRKGDVFVNEKSCARVDFNRETKTVSIVTKIAYKVQTETINDVERVRYVSDMHDEDYTTETSYLRELETTRDAWEDMRLTAYRVKNAISFPKPMDERTLENVKAVLEKWCGQIAIWEERIKNDEQD